MDNKSFNYQDYEYEVNSELLQLIKGELEETFTSYEHKILSATSHKRINFIGRKINNIQIDRKESVKEGDSQQSNIIFKVEYDVLKEPYLISLIDEFLSGDFTNVGDVLWPVLLSEKEEIRPYYAFVRNCISVKRKGNTSRRLLAKIS